MNIWEFTDYREYLTSRIGPSGTRSGVRKQLAESIGIHTTYVSQVLKGTAQFSLEQAESINDFFNHTEDEGEYFLLLVMLDRAGSTQLKSRFESRLKKLRENQVNISRRIEAEEGISESDKSRFYSSAIYGVVHVLSSLPGLNTSDDIAEAIHMSKRQMAEIVQFLVNAGLIANVSGKLQPGKKHIHLSNETEWVLKHHTNWRSHAIQQLQFINKEDVHYSSALSISEEDAFKVKELLMGALKDTVEIVKATEVETAYALNFDFYKLID